MITTLLTVAAVLTNGLLAGVFLAFVCAISPAYLRLSDGEFVRGFRAINAVIVRPGFLTVFLGAPLTAVAAVLARTIGGAEPPGVAEQAATALLWVGAVASVISFLITVTVNVPLNRGLDRAAVETDDELHAARIVFETRWTRGNRARTAAGAVAVCALAAAVTVG